MSKRNLIIAAIVLVLLAFVSQWFGRSGKEQKDEIIGKPLLLPAQVESFDQLAVQDAEGKLTLKKQQDSWIVEEMNGYPASSKKLLELVDKLTSNNVASLVTKDEARMSHFNVVYWDEDKANKKNSGTQLILSEKEKPILKMILGKTRESKTDNPQMPAMPDGIYVRIGDAKTVYLLKNNITVETKPSEWIQKVLFGIQKKEIQAVGFEVSGEKFKLERPEKGKNLTLPGIKEGQKIEEFDINSIMSDLEEFEIDEVFERSAVKENGLELKSVVNVASYENPNLSFSVLSRKSADSNDDKALDYFISFSNGSTPEAKEKWPTLFKLNENWIFGMEDWKAERWVKQRKDFIKE